MKIKWIGHSMFVITSQKGTRIVTDPFATGCFNGALSYDAGNVSADIVTVSHNSHDDHNAVGAVRGEPVTFEGPGAFSHGDVEALGVATFHDENRGADRGENTVFRITVDGINVVHLGDLGHELDENQKEALAGADVTLAPYGGFFTIDGRQAMDVAQSLGTRILIPMHFKTPKVDFPIKPVDDFLKSQSRVKRTHTTEVELHSDALPKELEVWVLDYAG
jgi:L-ascorbate metabolism protein UlaG (beta-lactamase superfamily)